MRYKKVYPIIIAAFLIIASLTLIYVNKEEELNVYDYPVRPGTEEWNAFTTTSEMMEACQIPEDIVQKMNTKELAYSVLDFPLIINLRALDTGTPGQNVHLLSQEFHALASLMERSDVTQTLIMIYKDMPVYESRKQLEELGLMNYSDDGTPYFYHMEYEYIETILAKCYLNIGNETEDAEERDVKSKEIIVAVNEMITKRLEFPEVYPPSSLLFFYTQINYGFRYETRTAEEVREYIDNISSSYDK